ncbi:MAG: non-homologous end-joining DNA ligase [Candidatus Binatia bacterium]
MATTIKAAGREIVLSNLAKVMYPDTGFTKGQVIEYYRAIARYILPHLQDRPITMKRFPDGISREHFYEKDAPSFTPDWIKTFPIPRTSKNTLINYILINDVPTLIWSANMANLELHPFLAKAPQIEQPTMVVFDLDPGDGADILNSCEVAFIVKRLLDRLNLKSFAKVSGSKGIHLHIPLNTGVTYQATQPFAKSIAEMLASEHPDRIVSEMPKAKRKGKVLIDWSQNSEHKSTAAVYSLRARPNGPFVALPITWDELKKVVKKADASRLNFEPAAALKKVKKTGDLFAPLLKLKQKLPQPFLDLMEVAGEAKALDTYRQKRDFTKTPEPAPKVPRSSHSGSRKLFVIQKHLASHLHYDFRLEMGGTLKSWAVPKGPPYDLTERRLAMATEDHPMEYANFEGVIPKGEYGGGTVMVWDTGTYELMDGNYWKGKLHFFLNGKKLKGEWILVKGHNDKGKDNTWYLMKAGTGMERLSAKKDDSSALSARSMEQIAQARDAVWHSNRNGSQTVANVDLQTDIDMQSWPAERVKFIEPMLATPVAKLPDDTNEWTYQVKLDGYRCLAGRNSRGVKIWSRRGNLFNRDFPGMAEACAALPIDTLIDGEIVALDEQGRASFNLLQHHRSAASAIRLYAFDLLVYRGRSTIAIALTKRQELLAAALGEIGDDIQLLESFETSPVELLNAAKELGFEGIVAKRKDSVYEPGTRSRAWLKYKINQGQEFVVGGYTPGNPFDAVIVGYYDGGKLLFAGKVRAGFVSHVRREVMAMMKPLETDICPFANLPEQQRRTQWALTREEMKNCVWLEPRLVVQIEFTEWTADGHLRHATFVGLRQDKIAREVVREPT